MDRVFNSVIRSPPGMKSTAPVSIPALMLLQSQHTGNALMGAILQRLSVDDENSSVQTLVMLLNLSLDGRIKSPRDIDDMLAKVTEYGLQHTQWPDTLRWICALTHFHCSDVMTVAQLGEIDAMDVPTAALVNFPTREDCVFAASTMIEHFSCVTFKPQTLAALRTALQSFPENAELCRAVLKAVVNATTFWGGSSDPQPSVEHFVNSDGAGVAAVLAAMQGPLAAQDDVILCTRALSNFAAYHREATRALVVQAVLDVLAAQNNNDAVASNVLSYLAQGSSHVDVQSAKVLETVLALFAAGVERAASGQTRLLTDVIHTLGAFATHWKESKSRMASSGVVEDLLSVMQKYMDDAVMQQQSCNLLSYLCFDSEVITNTVTRSGGVVLVLNSMRKFRNNEPLLTAACAAISGLTFNNPAGQSVVKQEDAVPLLLDILSKGTRPRLVEMACLALGTLCWNIDLKAAIAEAHGIDLIVNALEKHASSSGVVKNACRALAQIAFNSEKYRDDMTQRGAIRLIIHGMSLHPQHDRAQLHACAALSYLSWTSSSNATDILQHDGYRAIIRAMSHNLPNHEVQEHACRALANITGAPPADTENALQSIVDAMQRHDRVPEVQEEACRAIVTLALAAPENKTKLHQRGVASVVVNALRRFSSIQLVQQEAANAIAHLAYEHADLNKAITDLEAVSLLITAMKNFPANSKLQLNACGGLSALAFNNQVAQRQVSDLGGVPHILRAMKEFDRVRILELGCSLLGTLAWNPLIKEKVAEACVPTIISTMRNHPENPCLQKATIRAAAQFAFDSEKNRVLLYEAGAVALIIKALRDHRSNSKLVSHALVALTYLCWENGSIADAIIDSDALQVVEEVMAAHTECDRVLNRAQHLCKILQRKASPNSADVAGFPPSSSPLAPFGRPGQSQSGSFSPPGSPHKSRRNAPPFDDMSDVVDSPVSLRGPGSFPRLSNSSSFSGSPVGPRSNARPSSAGRGNQTSQGQNNGGRGTGGGGRGSTTHNAWGQSRGQAHRGGGGNNTRGK